MKTTKLNEAMDALLDGLYLSHDEFFTEFGNRPEASSQKNTASDAVTYQELDKKKSESGKNSKIHNVENLLFKAVTESHKMSKWAKDLNDNSKSHEQGNSVDPEGENLLDKDIKITLPRHSDIGTYKKHEWLSTTSCAEVVGLDSDANMNLSVLEVYYPMLTPASRNTDVAETFMTLIPTVELSKCQPYLNIGFRGKEYSGNSPILSLEQLLGFNNNDIDITTLNTKGKSKFKTLDLQDPDEVSKEDQVDIIGMEMFTTPQTLLTASGYTTRSGAVPIDRNVPLVTLKSVNMKTHSTHGMIPFKEGGMSLTLHDRGRLGDIAHLVTPDLYKTLEIVIEHGWIHPEGGRPGDSNYWADFLNSLRVVDVFGVKNSAMTFTNSGEIEVALSIYLVGNTSIESSYISGGLTEGGIDLATLSNTLKTAFTQVSKITSKIRQVESRIKNISGLQFMNTVTDTNASLNISGETLNEIKKFVKKKHDNQDLNQLRRLLLELYGDLTKKNSTRKRTRSVRSNSTAKVGKAPPSSNPEEYAKWLHSR